MATMAIVKKRTFIFIMEAIEMFRHLRFCSVVLGLLLFSSGAFGQGTTGHIAGTVSDPNGAVVTGAVVKATNIATNYNRETTTDGDGIYGFQLLPPGRYRVEISASGFAATTVEADVNITQTTPVDVQLTVAGGTATVDVQAPDLQTETSQQGRVITGETIRQLPLSTRNFQQLLTLLPHQFQCPCIGLRCGECSYPSALRANHCFC